MRVQSIAKSFLLAFAGTGIVSFFLMMSVIPLMALIQRLSGDVSQRSVVVNPAAFMRTYGVGLAAVTFVVLFVLGMKRFGRAGQEALPRH
jgi:hypothetical protein